MKTQKSRPRSFIFSTGHLNTVKYETHKTNRIHSGEKPPELPDGCNMYLMYYLNEKGERVYTFSKVDPSGRPTMSAHPAKFSPEDKYSRERILIKKRFGILPTQLPPLRY